MIKSNINDYTSKKLLKDGSKNRVFFEAILNANNEIIDVTTTDLSKGKPKLEIDEKTASSLTSEKGLYNWKYINNKVVNNVQSIESAREIKIKQLSIESFTHETKHVPPYKKTNAMIGNVYTSSENTRIIEFGSKHCRTAFYDAKALVEKASTLKAVEAVEGVWPKW